MNPVMVDVVMTSYNKGRYIGAALDSVLSQKTDKIAEIIICDDGSTDNTFDVIADYQKKYLGKIRLIKNKENLGACRNTRFSFEQGSSAFIAGIDADDYWSNENKIDIMLSAMIENPELIVCVHAIDVLQSDNTILKSGCYVEINKIFSQKFTKISSKFLTTTPIWGCFFVSAGFLLLRRDALKNIFTPEFIKIYDSTPYIAESFCYSIYHISQDSPRIGYFTEPMAVYRQNETNMANFVDQIYFKTILIVMFARLNRVFKDSYIISFMAQAIFEWHYPRLKEMLDIAKSEGKNEIVNKCYQTIIDANEDELFDMFDFRGLFNESFYVKFKRDVKRLGIFELIARSFK